MSLVVAPDEEELYLLSIMDAPDGLDLAEFSWFDPESEDGCYRAWDFQWAWYTNEAMFQVDQGGRALGKTVSITMRACAMPFCYPGQKMLLTAPELNHLRPLTDAVEQRLLSTRMLRELLPENKSQGMNRQPHWMARFKNGTQIVSRLPNKDGKGVKGQHVLMIELDEAQDYPLAGWIEIVETLNRFMPGAMWRCHGVPKGVRDKFFEMTEGATEEDKKWFVHRPMAPHRPSWSKEERDEKIKEYGGSRQSIDYKRNIYGEHGDASNSVFVLSRLMQCVDVEEGSEYNSEVYARKQIDFESLPIGPSITNEIRTASLLTLIDLPQTHLHGWSQTKDRKEVGAPKGYESFWGGADIGVTNHPSEFLIFGQRRGSDHIDLLTRIQLNRINTDDQKAVVEFLFAFYGSKLRAFALDKTGVGFPIWDQLSRHPSFGSRIYGYNFSEKVPVAFEDRKLEKNETKKDLAIWRNVVEATTDFLRNDFVDAKKILLPYDREVLLEFQGQTYCQSVDTEILTKRGWLTHDQLVVGDETLGLASDMSYTWTAVEAVNVFPAVPREMVRLSGASHDSYSTANHRWLGRPYHHAKQAVWRESRDLLADDVNFRVPLTGKPSLGTERKWDDDFVELVAWYFTEGHRVPGGKVGLSQSPTANPVLVARIEALLERLLGPGNHDVGRGRRGAGRWTVTTAKRPGAANTYAILDRELSARVFEVAEVDKAVDAAFLVSLTQEQLKLFIDVALLGDGCEFERTRAGRKATNVRSFIQNHRGRSDAFQMACALAGQVQQTSEHDGRFVTSLMARQGAHVSSMSRELVVDAVEVWCPTTATGTWLARRGGKAFFTGNTVIKDSGNPYGTKRLFGGGSFHTLDAAKMVMAGKILPTILEMLDEQVAQQPVMDVFVGAY